MRIYVASSWRNPLQQIVVERLRKLGHIVYDFKHPNGGEGFQWSNIDRNWQNWTSKEFRANLVNDYAAFGFRRDFKAMREADVCVLCLPCGRSAHLEAGWMAGAGKRVVAYIPLDVNIEPELMYSIVDYIAIGINELEDIITFKSLLPDTERNVMEFLGIDSIGELSRKLNENPWVYDIAKKGFKDFGDEEYEKICDDFLQNNFLIEGDVSYKIIKEFLQVVEDIRENRIDEEELL